MRCNEGMEEVIVKDANVLIDLMKIGLMVHCSALGFKFHTTDSVKYEIKHLPQAKLLQTMVDNGQIVIDTIADDDYTELLLMHMQYSQSSNLTEADCSVMLLAEKLKARLLTSDQKLIRQAKARGIQVNGILWLTDKMVERGVVSKPEMIKYLEKLKETNQRAPRNLIEDRIAKYREYVI